MWALWETTTTVDEVITEIIDFGADDSLANESVTTALDACTESGLLESDEPTFDPDAAPVQIGSTRSATPTYRPWMNLVERWFGELTTKWRRRRTHRSVRELVASIRTWIADSNTSPRPRHPRAGRRVRRRRARRPRSSRRVR